MDIFSELYRSYRDHIFYYFYRTLHNPYLAEDLTHDTFLKAFRSLGSFRGEASLKNWLYIIAANTYRNYLAKNKPVSVEETDLLPDYSDAYRQVNERIIIEHVFGGLTEAERELIALRDGSSFTYREIAKLTGLSEGQVRVRLHRARKKFRQIYTVESREV